MKRAIASIILSLVAFLGYCDEKYLVDRTEHLALVYLFGSKIAGEIENIVIISDSKAGQSLALYVPGDLRIYVNAKLVDQFHDRLAIAHEGTHYYQRTYLHSIENSAAGVGAYRMTTYEVSNKLPIEKEAELVRALGMFYVQDTLGVSFGGKMFVLPEPIFTDFKKLPDTMLVRGEIWKYLQVYMNLSRPEVWWVGSLP